jgi:hypothetical protein
MANKQIENFSLFKVAAFDPMTAENLEQKIKDNFPAVKNSKINLSPFTTDELHSFLNYCYSAMNDAPWRVRGKVNASWSRPLTSKQWNAVNIPDPAPDSFEVDSLEGIDGISLDFQRGRATISNLYGSIHDTTESFKEATFEGAEHPIEGWQHFPNYERHGSTYVYVAAPHPGKR